MEEFGFAPRRRCRKLQTTSSLSFSLSLSYHGPVVCPCLKQVHFLSQLAPTSTCLCNLKYSVYCLAAVCRTAGNLVPPILGLLYANSHSTAESATCQILPAHSDPRPVPGSLCAGVFLLVFQTSRSASPVRRLRKRGRKGPPPIHSVEMACRSSPSTRRSADQERQPARNDQRNL